MSSSGGGGGGGDGLGRAPLDGAFLLQLLRNPPQSQSQSRSPQSQPLPQIPHQDPAVASVGPTYPFAPHTFFRPNPPLQQPSHHRGPPPGFAPPRFPSPNHQRDPRVSGGRGFDSRAPRGGGGRDNAEGSNISGSSYGQRRNSNNSTQHLEHGNHYTVQRHVMAEQRRSAGSVTGYRVPAEWVPLRVNQRDGNGEASSLGRLGGGSANQRMASEKQHYYHFEEFSGDLEAGEAKEEDDLSERQEDSLVIGEDGAESNNKNGRRSARGKDVRIDLFRGHYVSSQRVRFRRSEVVCRFDIDSLSPLFLSIYKSLIPADEEKRKQDQLLLSLRKLVNKEWPDAQLHLYGSCANSFGVSASDVDICLAIDDSNMSKSDILLKLADILQSDNLQNVQALTHARVPIVKMMDPVTGISCDICINNLLAVANTKLLRDYAQIDVRLRQLAFIVKHWAKSRGVNETYKGTLSSYAYVIMCIHFLQQRRPAILPCLQEMEPTYVVNIEGIQCAYFDQVDRLHNFGSRNNESIARLLWGFFHYWAYYHDYTSDVISVRAGRNISKRLKDWTRRIGNDRHLICIEDPFETSHDLGRVVDKYSIKILREEFERAADLLQFEPNPITKFFEPYVPRPLPNGLQPSDNWE